MPHGGDAGWVAVALMREITPVLAGAKILLTAQRDAEELATALIRRGAEVVSVPTLPPPSALEPGEPADRTRDRWRSARDPAAVARAVAHAAAGDFDAVVFISPASAAAWAAEVGEHELSERIRDHLESGRMLLAALEPVTAQVLRERGFWALTPTDPRIGALVRLVIRELAEESASVATPSGLLRVRASAATLNNEVLPLSPNGLAILRCLARRPGEVVSRDRLLEVLPGGSADPHTAEVAVARLREALNRATGSQPLVRTVIKRGYVLQTS